MRRVPLSEMQERLPQILREAETEMVVIVRHGVPAGVLIGFESAAQWLDYRLAHDPDFRCLVEKALTLARMP
jgi:prevent-host-death family protein